MDSILIVTLLYILNINGGKTENLDHSMYMDHIA